MGENAGSIVSTCAPRDEALNLWAVAENNADIIHSWWEQEDPDDIEPEDSGNTSKQGCFYRTEGNQWRTELENASSALHCISRPDVDALYDVAYYVKDTKQAIVASFSRRKREWHYQRLEDGDWVGEPHLFDQGDEDDKDEDRWDFFGVQSDKTLYHQTWTSDSFANMERLGGSIISRPAVVRLGSGTFDVVALGSNGTLQHLYFNGDEWEENWEDLGLEASSAPVARLHNNQVVLLALARNGSLIAWTRDNRRERSWRGSFRAENLAGALSLDGI